MRLSAVRFKPGDQVRLSGGRGGVWRVVAQATPQPHETEAAYHLDNGRRVRTATESKLLLATEQVR